MKTVFVGLALFLSQLSSQAHASSIDSTCSDASQSFLVSGHGGGLAEVVRIRTTFKGDFVELTADEQVSIEFTNEQALPEQRGPGSTIRTASYLMTIRPLGNTVLPSAYSRNKNADGSLSELVVCKTTYTSSPIFKGNK